MAVVFDGSEVEVLALEPSKPRIVTVVSTDGKFTSKTVVDADDPQPMTIQLEPAASVSGRLLEDTTGLPLAGYTPMITAHPFFTGLLKTDTDGRFVIHHLLPTFGTSISFQEPHLPSMGVGYTMKVYRPAALQDLVLSKDEARDLGDIRIQPPAAAKAAPAPAK
jgi:hypothetical protein